MLLNTQNSCEQDFSLLGYTFSDYLLYPLLPSFSLSLPISGLLWNRVAYPPSLSAGLSFHQEAEPMGGHHFFFPDALTLEVVLKMVLSLCKITTHLAKFSHITMSFGPGVGYMPIGATLGGQRW